MNALAATCGAHAIVIDCLYVLATLVVAGTFGFAVYYAGRGQS